MSHTKVNGHAEKESHTNGEVALSPYGEWLYEVYASARDGILTNLSSLLENKSITEVNDALNHMTDEDGFKAPPLVIAAKNGHKTVVKELIVKYKVYKEQAGLLNVDSDIIEGATALWSAVAFNHMETVKILLELGAEINMVCPLRPAVFEDNMDMVKLLVEHGAMVNIPSRYYNNTCLMLAASQNNNADIVTYLLEHGANMNAKDQEGRTVLHHAAEKGSFDIVRTLLDAGVGHCKDFSRITPVQVACMNQREVAAKYLIDHVDLSNVEEIEALELLGASFQDCPDSFDTVYNYLHRGMELRMHDSTNVIHKIEIAPIDEYNQRVEAQTIDELKQFEENPMELNFQALLVKERILGEDHEFVHDSITYVAGYLADNKRWAQSVMLLSRAIKLKIRNKFRISNTLMYLCKLLVVMVDANAPPYASQIMQSIDDCLQDIGNERTRLLHAPLLSEQLECLYGIENATLAFLHLQTIILKLERTAAIDDQIYSAMRKFNELDIKLKLKDMRTPLHVLCSSEFEVDHCLFDEVVTVPHIGVLKVMFMNGFRADVVDSKGNTPLHFVLANPQAYSDKKMLKDVLDMFFKAGALLNVVNVNHKKPLDMISDKIAKYLKGEFRKTRYKALFTGL